MIIVSQKISLEFFIINTTLIVSQKISERILQISLKRFDRYAKIIQQRVPLRP